MSNVEANNKRQRLNPTSRDDDDDDESPSLSFTDLPSEAVLRILSFFDSSERLQLTLVFNKRLLEEIEEYSKRVYEKIKSEHRADETFAGRVADQTNLRTAITRRAKPVAALPFRYLSSAAMRKPLYTREIGGRDIEWKVILSPSEDILAVKGERNVYLCNLSQRDAPAKVLSGWLRGPGVLFLEDDRIVTSSGRGLRLWSPSPNNDDADWEGETIFDSHGTDPPFVIWPVGSERIREFLVSQWITRMTGATRRTRSCI